MCPGWEVKDNDEAPANTFSDLADANELRWDAVQNYEQKELETVRDSLQRPAGTKDTTASPAEAAGRANESNSTVDQDVNNTFVNSNSPDNFPARSDKDLRSDLADAVAMNSATAPDATTREMMHAATHLGKGEAGYRSKLHEIEQVSQPSSIGSGRARVQAAADSTADAILKKGVKGREWLKDALRDAEQKSGVRLLPDDVADVALTDLQLREAYGKASMMFFGIESPKVNGTGTAVASAWRKPLHDSPLGHALRADGRVHAAALKGAANTAVPGMRVKKTKQKTATNETTLVADTSASKRDTETANTTEPGSGHQPPNGKPSKLTEPQQQKVRTPEFKQQFGDWEAAEMKQWIEGDPVATLTGNEFAYDASKPLSQRVAEWFKSGGRNDVATRLDIGTVELSRGIKSSWFHGKGVKKAAAYAAVPAIIEKGRIIKRQPNYKPGVERIIIAAPVSISSQKHTGIVVLQRDSNVQRFYVHEVFEHKKMPQTSSTAGTFAKGVKRSSTDAEALRSIADNLLSVNPDTISKIVDVNGEPLVVYPVGSQGDTGLIFTTDKSRASNEGMLDQPVFLKGFNEGEDFSWDRGSGLITVKSPEQVIPANTIDSEKHSSDKSNESFKSYEDYWIQNNPEHKILTLIEKYKLSKHLSGKRVVYSGSKLGVSGGVHPLFPDVIKIYDEGLSFDDRYFVETLIEEIHHSKFLKLYPDSGLPRNNKWWNSFVEPRAKEYAKHYADRIFGDHEGN